MLQQHPGFANSTGTMCTQRPQLPTALIWQNQYQSALSSIIYRFSVTSLFCDIAFRFSVTPLPALYTAFSVTSLSLHLHIVLALFRQRQTDPANNASSHGSHFQLLLIILSKAQPQVLITRLELHLICWCEMVQFSVPSVNHMSEIWCCVILLVA